MKKQKLMSVISNILLAIGAALGALALYLSFSLRAGLPAGVCPIDNNRPLLYISVAILIASFVFSVVADRLKKREQLKP